MEKPSKISDMIKTFSSLKIIFICFFSDCYWRLADWNFSWNLSAHGQTDSNLHEWRPWKTTLFWTSHYSFGKNDEKRELTTEYFLIHYICLLIIHILSTTYLKNINRNGAKTLKSWIKSHLSILFLLFRISLPKPEHAHTYELKIQKNRNIPKSGLQMA